MKIISNFAEECFFLKILSKKRKQTPRRVKILVLTQFNWIVLDKTEK